MKTKTTKPELNLDDFEVIEKIWGSPQGKYPNVPYLKLGERLAYLGTVAAKKLDVRDGEGIGYLRRGADVYMRRTAVVDTNSSFKVNKRGGKSVHGVGGYVIAGSALKRAGLAEGEYALSDPINVQSVDLFLLVPLAQYLEEQAAA